MAFIGPLLGWYILGNGLYHQKEISMSNITLTHNDGEARVDSRLVAEHLEVAHKATFQLLTSYTEDFEELGLLPFQMEKPAKGTPGGRPQRYALLNEDQAYLLLSYSKNTQKVRQLKLSLVKAFKVAREQAAIDSMLDMVLLPEPATWEKRFGDDYYRALAKVTGTHYSGHARGTPAIFGRITEQWVYSVIMPGEVVREMRVRRDQSQKLHQWLNDGGLSLLDRQIDRVTSIAMSSVDYADFRSRCTQAFGLPGQLRLVYPSAA